MFFHVGTPFVVPASLHQCFIINDNLESQLSNLFHILFDKDIQNTCTVGDFGEIVGGATPSTENADYFCKDGIVWLSPKDLTSTGLKFIFKGETDITETAYKSCSTKMLPIGSVLLTSRAPVGTVAIAMTDLCTNQGFKSIIPKNELGSEFVYYFLKENKALLDSHASGTTFMEISGTVLKSIPAFIPKSDSLLQFKKACTPVFNIQMQNEAEIKALTKMQSNLISQISCS